MTDAAGLGREFSTAVVMFHDAVAHRLGLTAVDHKALGVIVRDGPMAASRLARQLAMKPSAVTGLVDRLVAAGYVTRNSDPLDRRRVLISADGGEHPELLAIFQRLGREMTKLAERYDAAQLDAIMDYLTNATTVLREQTAALVRE
ncbi:DNA-binding MarR family transcriptional regulator [Stackebrandtia endophytica]|uniref:DNA-binding MarR family transcriptional regulator n=1 Tax=Stackebrandtia endophytica TaxID=1496996 RepID=A0A543AXA6_9ACTN|nr:MarR family transcriptional regulator [Stackebrandtia endophytica]TQL77211.1 DNA-binding MarR family transcriptional regulator [Stackebrandtia endophytica]